MGAFKTRWLLSCAGTAALAMYLSAPARADALFDICPSGRTGVIAGTPTSCAFADNVRQGFFNQGQPSKVFAYSPVTGQVYDMLCTGPFQVTFSGGQIISSVRCFGGNHAEVVFW